MEGVEGKRATTVLAEEIRTNGMRMKKNKSCESQV